MQALPPNDPVMALPAAPAPPTHVGRQEHRRGNQRATNPSTLEPARRARTKAPVSPRLAHWQRAWGMDGGRFALWAGCAVGSGGCLGPGGTLYGCPVGMRELLGPRRQVQPAARGAKRGAGSVVGSRGDAGRAQFHPHIRKPAPYQPYPYSRNLTGHPGQGCSRRVGGRTCMRRSFIQ